MKRYHGLLALTVPALLLFNLVRRTNNTRAAGSGQPADPTSQSGCSGAAFYGRQLAGHHSIVCSQRTTARQLAGYAG